MDVTEAVRTRRAYRSLDRVEVPDSLVEDLASHAALAPSCFNHQPWRFAFVRSEGALEGMHGALSKGNEWARAASMIVAVYSTSDLDCEVAGRTYYLFDTGLASAFLVLRATELGLVAHPIAGFDEGAVKGLLGLPPEMTVITLIIVGSRSGTTSRLLSAKQLEAERERPERKPFADYCTIV